MILPKPLSLINPKLRWGLRFEERTGGSRRKILGCRICGTGLWCLGFCYIELGEWIGGCRREVGPHVKNILGTWWVAQWDNSREVAKAARRAFQVGNCPEVSGGVEHAWADAGGFCRRGFGFLGSWIFGFWLFPVVFDEKKETQFFYPNLYTTCLVHAMFRTNVK